MRHRRSRRRFPLEGGRNVVEWSIYNMFMKKGSATDRKEQIASPTAAPDWHPSRRSCRSSANGADAVLEAIGEQEPALMNGNDGGGGPARLGI